MFTPIRTIVTLILAALCTCTISASPNKVTPLGKKILKNGVYYQYASDENIFYYDAWVVGYDKATLPDEVTIENKMWVPSHFEGTDQTYCNVIGIADSAFMDAENLTIVNIPQNVQYIGDRAFANCPLLTTVNIGNIYLDTQIKLERVGDYLFENCEGGADYNYNIDLNIYKWMVFQFDNNSLSNSWCNISLNLREGSKQFYESWSATQVATINETFEDLENMLFTFELNPDGQTYSVRAKTTDLPNDVVIPSYRHNDFDHKVTVIPEYGFRDCKHLRYLTLPASLETIGHMATHGCDSLYSLKIGDRELYGIADDDIKFAEVDRVLYSKDLTKMVLAPNGFPTTTPAALKEICPYAVHLDKNSSNRITIPSGVTTIGLNAFENSGNDATAYITLGKDVKEIARSIISNDNYLKQVTVDAANPYFTVSNNLIYTADKSTVVGYAGNNNSRSDATITIDEGTSAIRENAFTGSEALYKISIPASVTNIPDNMAVNSHLQSIDIAENNPAYMCYNSTVLLNKEGTSVIKVANYGANIEIPDGVESISPYAAYGIKAVNVKLPETLKEIPDSAFYNCTSLTGIAIPSGVSRIGNSAFENCTSLKSVTIGSEDNGTCALTSLGEKAFAGCTNISEVTVHKTEPPTAPASAFDNYNATLTVAKGAKTDYQNAGTEQAWANFAQINEPTPTTIEKIIFDSNDDVSLTVVGGTISLSGYNGTRPVRIYTAGGMNIYSGYSRQIDNLTRGIYIVTVGDKVIKTAIR